MHRTWDTTTATSTGIARCSGTGRVAGAAMGPCEAVAELPCACHWTWAWRAPMRGFRIGRRSTRAASGRGVAGPYPHRPHPGSARLGAGLARQAWSESRITGGTLDGRLAVDCHAAAAAASLRPLEPGRWCLRHARRHDRRRKHRGGTRPRPVASRNHDRAVIEGQLHGGELLFGSAYVSLQQRRVDVRVDASQQEGQGWRFPRIRLARSRHPRRAG